MLSFIEEFYYGNLEPQESTTELNGRLRKSLKVLTATEEQLYAKITDEDKDLFEKYLNQNRDFLCISNADSFISGFRHGAKFAYETFVVN